MPKKKFKEPTMLKIGPVIKDLQFHLNFAKFSRIPLKMEFKQRLAQLALNNIYNQLPMDKPFNLVIRWSEPGGPGAVSNCFGDMSHSIKISKLFRTHFPQANIFFAPGFHMNESISPQDESSSSSSQDTSIDEIDERDFGVLDPKSLPKYLQENYPSLPTLLFDVATPNSRRGVWPFANDALKVLKLSGCYHIDEYNGKRTKNEGFKGNETRNWFSSGLGLDQRGHPCIGVHLDPNMTEAKFPYIALAHLENPNLSHLFGLHLSTPPEVYFGYSSTYQMGYAARFLQAIISYESRNSDQDVDILLVIPGVEITDAWNELIEKFKHLNYHKCEVHSKNFTNSYLLNPQGKKRLRLIFQETVLSKTDFNIAMKCTGKAVLVTGDQSLSEAISMQNRVIFYESQYWKAALMDEMMALAEFHFGHDSKVYQFLELMTYSKGENHFYDLWDDSWENSKLGDYLFDKEFLTQFQQLMKLIVDKYDITNWLVGFVKGRLFNFYEPENRLDSNELAKAIKKDDISSFTTKLKQIAKNFRKTKAPKVNAKLHTIRKEKLKSPKSPKHRKKLLQKMKNIFKV